MAQVQVPPYIYRNLNQNQKNKSNNRLPNSNKNNKLKKNKNKSNQILPPAILQTKHKLLNLWVWDSQENNAFKHCEPLSTMYRELLNIYWMEFLPIYAICHHKISNNNLKKQKKDSN